MTSGDEHKSLTVGGTKVERGFQMKANLKTNDRDAGGRISPRGAAARSEHGDGEPSRVRLQDVID